MALIFFASGYQKMVGAGWRWVTPASFSAVGP